MIVEKPQWKHGVLAYRSTPETLKGGKWHYKAHGPFKIMGLIVIIAVWGK